MVIKSRIRSRRRQSTTNADDSLLLWTPRRSSCSRVSSAWTRSLLLVACWIATLLPTTKAQIERQSLEALYDATSGESWKINDQWKTTTEVCQWHGITCDSENKVRVVDLSRNNLDGSIPPEFWNLPDLRKLNVRNNLLTAAHFEGLLSDAANQPKSPVEILILSENHLKTLDGISNAKETLNDLNVNKNQIEVELPEELFECTKLETLYVAFNKIRGSLPTHMGRLSLLSEVYAYDNRFSGTLPTELGLLDRATVLGLGNNLFTGTIPTEVELMYNLRDFSIHQSVSMNADATKLHKGLSGRLPSFADMPNLALIFFDGNSLTGSIPADFLRNNQLLDQAVSVGLTDNRLTGTIPKSLERFNEFTIHLTGSQIEAIPDALCSKGGWMGGLVEEFGCDAILCPIGTYNELGMAYSSGSLCLPCNDGYPYLGASSCENTLEDGVDIWEELSKFYQALAGDKWTIRDGWEVFDDLAAGGTLDELEDFGIDICDGWYGILCDGGGNITDIDLPNNELFGTVPNSIFSLPSLETLDISNNNIQISSFEGIDASSGLVSLVISNVKVDSMRGIGSLEELEHLYADGLNIKAPLPQDIFDLSSLKTLHVQHGHFTGAIPTEIGRLGRLEKLNMYGNELSGEIPTEIGELTMLRDLELSENQFTGVLPTELGELTELETIAIHQSESAGSIAGQLLAFDTLPELRELNLESNMLTGQIPNNFLARVADKGGEIIVSLGSNDLQGSIPASLNGFDKLVLNLEGNFITSIPAVLCNKNNWMEGNVGALEDDSKCNGILCPPGTWNDFGKATTAAPCTVCNQQPLNLTPDWEKWYGRMSCGDVSITREKEILDKLFSSTGGRYWTAPHENWVKPGAPLCQREGVFCASNGEILELRMNQFGLRGTIPSEIWELSNARQLAFTKNEVDISFDGIEKAAGLKVLKLSKCHLRTLEGIGKASNKLGELHLAENQFNGTVPEDIFELGSVNELFINNNHFEGRIPSDFVRMTGLRRLELFDNQFSGQLPTEVGLLTSLTALDIQQNQLTGVLPTELQLMTSLVEINLSAQAGSGFEGQFPTFETSLALASISAAGNSFSGILSPNFLSIMDPNSEIVLDLSDNDIAGPIPEEWDRFQSLVVDLSGNRITGIPDVLCSKTEWNNGRVGLFGTCDAILCPLGSFANTGRQIEVAQPCTQCPGDATEQILSAPYYGTKECLELRLVEEKQRLVSFYENTNGTSWLLQTNWLSDNSACSWHGIVCDENDHIVEIVLSNNLMEGNSEAKDEISKILTLKDLRILDLKGNKIDLDFNAIGPVSNLETLRMSGTGLQSLTGIGRASSLKALHVTNNDIKIIPEEVYSMDSLESLFLSYNGITGTLSRFFGLMTGLKELYMFGNRITGSIPKEMGQMTGLIDLILARNYLSGTLPAELSNLPNLEQFSTYEQQGADLITGPVPSFSGTKRLWHFDASSNDLTGPLPDNFLINSLLKNDTVSIYLQNNEITGTIPMELSKFRALDINLANNKILVIPDELCSKPGWMQGQVGTIGGCSAILCPAGTFNQFGHESDSAPCDQCDLLQDDPYLGHVNCENFSSERNTLLKLYEGAGGEFWENSTNWLTEAPICSWQGVKCSDGDKQDLEGVVALQLEENGLSGTLPSEVWTLPALRTLNVKKNNGLHVDLNGLSSASDTLEVLDVSSTTISSLSGLGSATNLKQLGIDGNRLKGTFPLEILQLSGSLEMLYMANNLFYGTLPTELGLMTKLNTLQLQGNDFLSTIPTELGLLQDLRILVLADNIIYGEIPQELSTMPSLRLFAVFRFDKSGPRLSGTLPSLDGLPSLTDLLLQGNDIQGSIPIDFVSASTGIELLLLGSNLITGSVPEILGQASALQLGIAENLIEDFPPSFCAKTDWMQGAVGQYGCDAILCPLATAGPEGRVSPTSECTPCPENKESKYLGAAACSTDQREILMNFYYSLNGDSWNRRDFWGSTADICDWYGVGCNSGKIVLLNLSANNLRGIPNSDIFNLSELHTLWLYSNPIEFSFENIGSATKLLDLRLDSTQLHTLRGIGAAISLVTLDVSFTALRGKFPADEILRLTNLRRLKMNDNALSGSLPKSFDQVRFLASLRLDSNKLSGNLPSFEGMDFLRYLDVSGNAIEGPLSRNFLERLRSDERATIRLSHNQITGVVPQELDRFTDMTIDLTNNEILGLPLILCDNTNWNGGDVGRGGCNAILCSPGTSNVHGRQKPGSPCLPCPQATYYGSTLCPFGSSSPHRGMAATLGVSTLVTTLWFIL